MREGHKFEVDEASSGPKPMKATVEITDAGFIALLINGKRAVTVRPDDGQVRVSTQQIPGKNFICTGYSIDLDSYSKI